MAERGDDNTSMLSLDELVNRLRDDTVSDVERGHLLVEYLRRTAGDYAHLLEETLIRRVVDRSTNLCWALLAQTAYVPRWFDWLSEPLLLALQEEDSDECSACRPLLKQLHMVLSGSRQQGLCINYLRCGSNFDIMCEYGPVDWVCDKLADTAVPAPPPHVFSIADLSRPVMQLKLSKAGNPGFYLIRRVPSHACQHGDWCLLRADSIRQLCKRHAMFYEGLDWSDTSGPALTSIIEDVDFDRVACLQLPYWPDLDATLRERLAQLPCLPAAAAADIEQGGVHLVPVGRHGSPTEDVEWRLSFCRPEAVTALHLPSMQRRTIQALKLCKGRLGRIAEAVKSYYLLTAMLWLSLEMPPSQWTGVSHGAACVLSRLRQAVTARRLPCFFMSSINVLRPETEDDWTQLSEALAEMQCYFTPLVLSFLPNRYRMELLGILLPQGRITSEDQVRECSARVALAFSFHRFIIGNIGGYMLWWIPQAYLNTPQQYWTAAFKTAMSRPIEAVRRRPGAILLEALLVAPAAVAARVRLQRTGHCSADCAADCVEHCTWTWHVQPLIELLTEADLDDLFGRRREELIRWCLDQHALPAEERAAEVPADPISPSGTVQLLTRPATLAAFLSRTDASLEQPRVDRDELNKLDFFHCRSSRPRLTDAYRRGRERLHMDDEAAIPFARRYSQHDKRHWDAPDAQQKYESSLTSTEDPWQLDKYRDRLLDY